MVIERFSEISKVNSRDLTKILLLDIKNMSEESSLVPFMKKKFHESLKGRVYAKGLHLVAQDIAAIHKQLLTKNVKEVALYLRMDVRTVKKYSY